MSEILSSFAAEGRRKYQEDRHLTATTPEGTLLAVFDGHGGAQVSEAANEALCGIWDEVLANSGMTVRCTNHTDDPKTCNVIADTIHIPTIIQEVFRKLDEKTNFLPSGSTASIVFIPFNKEGDWNATKIAYVAILGDSPVIIRDKDGKINISPEHNVRSNVTERNRCMSRGGVVDNGYVFKDFYSSHGIQMSRALGDTDLVPVITREPEVYSVELGPKSWAMVATDGVFDPGHESMDGVDDVAQMIDGGCNAEAIVDRALKIPTGDNVTVILWRRDNE